MSPSLSRPGSLRASNGRALRALLCALALAAFGLGGCAAGTDDLYPSVWEPLLGSWFFCSSADCVQPGGLGIRFVDDGTYGSVRASEPDRDPTLAHCIDDAAGSDFGSFEFDGTKLVLHEGGGRVRTTTVSLSNDNMTLIFSPTFEQYLLRVAETALAGPCR